MLVPDVSVDDEAPSVKRQLCCAPDSAGITSTTLPPTSTRPAVVNDTVATDAYPGVSTAVANVADVSAPDIIWSVAIDDVLSTSLSCESRVVASTLFTPTTDDGVSAFVIVNTHDADCARSFAPTVSTSVRVPNVYPTDTAAGALLLGVVNVIVGALLVPDVSVDDEAPSVKRQVCCVPDSSGITSTTLPPTSTRPAVVNDTVATDSYPGVSTAVAKVADVSTPDAI